MIQIHTCHPERSEGPLYLTAALHRSFAALKMTTQVLSPINLLKQLRCARRLRVFVNAASGFTAKSTLLDILHQ